MSRDQGRDLGFQSLERCETPQRREILDQLSQTMDPAGRLEPFHSPGPQATSSRQELIQNVFGVWNFFEAFEGRHGQRHCPTRVVRRQAQSRFVEQEPSLLHTHWNNTDRRQLGEISL